MSFSLKYYVTKIYGRQITHNQSLFPLFLFLKNWKDCIVTVDDIKNVSVWENVRVEISNQI